MYYGDAPTLYSHQNSMLWISDLNLNRLPLQRLLLKQLIRIIFDAGEQEFDADKYKRRRAVQWFTRWFGLRKQNRAVKEDSNSPLKRTAIIVFLVILVVITLIVMMTRVGRISANSDPLLDPMANPHIRIEDD
jgi:hypothetical protein